MGAGAEVDLTAAGRPAQRPAEDDVVEVAADPGREARAVDPNLRAESAEAGEVPRRRDRVHQILDAGQADLAHADRKGLAIGRIAGREGDRHLLGPEGGEV